jgi:hypothetical protein
VKHHGSHGALMQLTGSTMSGTVARGFVRQADGTFTTLDVARSTWTEPEYMNDAGEITGYYLETVQGISTPQGFLRAANGKITKFNSPCDAICGSLPSRQSSVRRKSWA